MPKGKRVPMQVPQGVVADSVGPVLDRFGDFDAIPAMELVKLVCIADEEIHQATLWIGRALPQEHLHFAEVHARKRRRLAPGESQREAEFFSIEVNGRGNVVYGKSGVGLLAFDKR